MRYIDLAKLPIPAEWSDVELGLLAELELMTPQQRSAAFGTSRYRVWTWWARLLRGLSYDKCWYSERRLPSGKADVDHFRPKSAVSKKDAPEGHEGYWWLGVLVRNFRFSSQVCNQLRVDKKAGQALGKGTRFPLEPGCLRAASPSQDVARERPLLLDPTIRADVALIWFNEDGTVTSRNKDLGSIEAQRVMASRDCYHLNEQDVLTQRGVVCQTVRRLACALAKLEEDAADGDDAARRKLVRYKLRLLEMTRDYAEFSAAARATLKAYDFIRSAKEVLDAA